MNELTTDLKSLHEATLNNLKSSKSINTLRAYKSDFKDFGAFCAKHGLAWIKFTTNRTKNSFLIPYPSLKKHKNKHFKTKISINKHGS